MKERVKYKPDPVAVLSLLLSLLSFFEYERVLHALETVLRELTR
jgi:hypothetical protein